MARASDVYNRRGPTLRTPGGFGGRAGTGRPRGTGSLALVSAQLTVDGGGLPRDAPRTSVESA